MFVVEVVVEDGGKIQVRDEGANQNGSIGIAKFLSISKQPRPRSVRNIRKITGIVRSEVVGLYMAREVGFATKSQTLLWYQHGWDLS